MLLGIVAKPLRRDKFEVTQDSVAYLTGTIQYFVYTLTYNSNRNLNLSKPWYANPKKYVHVAMSSIPYPVGPPKQIKTKQQML